MQNNKEKKLIIKNGVSFIISLFPIYLLIAFGIMIKNNESLNGSKGAFFGIILMLYILNASFLVAIPAFCFTIKYIVDMIKNKQKVFIAIIEIVIYILIFLFFIVMANQSE